MKQQGAGFTLIEIVVASLIVAFVAGGTLMAFVTASRISAKQATPQRAEANALAQQTIDRFRNHVAADDNFLSTQADGNWHEDVLPVAGAGSESIRSVAPVTPGRVYCVSPGDCDGDGILAGAGVPPEQDCYAMRVRVCWAGTVCPAEGTDPENSCP